MPVLNPWANQQPHTRPEDYQQVGGMTYQAIQPPVATSPQQPSPQYSGGGSSSGGGGYTMPATPPERIGREGAAQSVGREGDINIPGVGALGELDAAGQRAQAAVFGRAKDRAGQIARSALTGLRSALAERGVLGSGMEAQATGDVALQGAGMIADTSREEAIQEARRGERAREFQTQSMLQQRGQNISQRGQDLSQILGLRGQDITQRGQDVSQRGQDISLMGLRNAGTQYNANGTIGTPSYSGDNPNDPLWQQQNLVRRY